MPAILLLIAIFAAGRIEATDPCKDTTDLLFIVDSSDSICGDDPACGAWNEILQFVHDIVDSTDVGSTATKVAFIKYGTYVRTEFNLDKYADNKTALLNAILNVKAPKGEFGGLNILTAHVVITEVYNVLFGDRLNSPNIVVVITDGMPGYDPGTTGLFANIFQLTGVKFIVVCVQGTNGNCSTDTAVKIASPVKSPVTQTSFFVDGYGKIGTIKEALSGQICAMSDYCHRYGGLTKLVNTVPLLGPLLGSFTTGLCL